MHLPSILPTPTRFLTVIASGMSIVASGLLIGALGCSIGTIEQSSPDLAIPVKGAALEGSVHGGQQPVTGATIQLYAAGTPSTGGGYGSGATALIPTGSYFPGGLPGCVASANGVTPVVTCTTLPTTDANGMFTITDQYNCPSATSQVYIVATGGNPGSTGVNSYIAMMSALGPCNSTNTAGKPSLSATLNIAINEVSTVASAYALQQFMSAPATNTVEAIGAPGNMYNGIQTAVVGLTNAFSMVQNLVNISTGASPGLTPNILVESSQINTLADIIAYCVNSVPPTSTNCATLMTDATPSGANPATDTLQAAFYMVNNPRNNVSALFKLISGIQPFVASTSAPTDFTLAVQYVPCANNTTGCPSSTTPGDTAPAIGIPSTLAIDAYGNAWILQAGKTTTLTSGTNPGTSTVLGGVLELSSTGTVLLPVVNTYTTLTTGYGAYSEFTTAPTNNLHTFAPGSFNSSIAIDLLNNVWAANERDATVTGGAPATGSVAHITGSAGTGLAPGGAVEGYYTGNSTDGIAIGPDNSAYIGSSGTGNVSSAAIDKFVAGSSSAYTYSTKTVTTSPYVLKGGLTLLAIGQATNVTNTRPTTPVTNDGSILYAADGTCTEAGTGTQPSLGALYEFTTTDIVPTSSSALVSSFGAGSPSQTLCPTTVNAGSEFSAQTEIMANIALDRYDGVWLTDDYTNGVGINGLTYLQTNPATGAVDPNYGSTTYSTGAGNTILNLPYGIAVDGANNAWVGNENVSNLAEFSVTQGSVAAMTTPTITLIGQPIGPTATKHFLCNSQFPAIDASGNVWTVNNGTCTFVPAPAIAGTTAGNSVVVIVGAAAPVVTPIAAAVKYQMLGQRP